MQVMHGGHRQRMYQRMAQFEEGMQEHELLEMLLYNALPRINTNDIAHRLLLAFGGIEGVFSATTEELLKVEGVGMNVANFLRVNALLSKRVYERKDYLPLSRVKFQDECFLEKLRVHYQSAEREEILLYALDKTEKIQGGNIYTSERKTNVRIAPEEVTQFLVAYKPVYLVIVHNHVSNDCNPSAEDDKFTWQVNAICQMNNVKFVEHLVFAKNGQNFSYRLSGKLEKIQEEQQQDKLIAKIFSKE